MLTFGQYLAEARKKDKKKQDPCWDGYTQFGMKNKNGKEVPNCIPEDIQEGDTLVFEDGTECEVVQEAEYEGREVELNKPTPGDVKKSKVYVRNKDGNVIKVNFGDPNSTIKKHIPARRKSFRARHDCDSATDKTTARYWSCRAW